MKTIFIRTTFDGIHNWKDAPDKVYYLRKPHRHRFYVELEIEVKHSNRELEFYIVKDWLDGILKSMLKDKSCEMMCEYIIRKVKEKWGSDRTVICEVSEDNENGARVYHKST